MPMLPIVIIDDDKHFRGALRLMLEQMGHQVLEAATGAQGVKFLQDYAISLVFIDLFMPDQDGLETLVQLRKQSADVPIIAISGGGFQGKLDCLPAASKLGATATLSKPFGSRTLHELLRKVQMDNASGLRDHDHSESPLPSR